MKWFGQRPMARAAVASDSATLPLSLILIAYNMGRELPRTVQSLTPPYQREITAQDYEIIVVDNGSREPLNLDACRRLCPNLRVLNVPNPTPSPVPAINLGLAQARGGLIGVWIDGARMASPGLLSMALRAARLHPRPIIGTLGFHLGPELQTLSIQRGYDQHQEDALLAAVGWEANGYRLFEISCFAGSSIKGWFGNLAEANALFLGREHWAELGGYDPQFQLPGGGLANLDMWHRACGSPSGQVILLLGEGTFHQIHGGVATNAVTDKYPLFDQEYQRLRGHPYRSPPIDPIYLGRVPSQVLPKMAESVNLALNELAG